MLTIDRFVDEAKKTPPQRPSAPALWRGTLNAFGKEIGWPAAGRIKVPAERVDLARLRSAGVTAQWAAQQARIYREVARLNPTNPTAALRAAWLERISERLRGTLDELVEEAMDREARNGTRPRLEPSPPSAPNRPPPGTRGWGLPSRLTPEAAAVRSRSSRDLQPLANSVAQNIRAAIRDDPAIRTRLLERAERLVSHMIKILRDLENSVRDSRVHMLRSFIQRLGDERTKIWRARLRLAPMDLDALREVAERIPRLAAVAVRLMPGPPRAI